MSSSDPSAPGDAVIADLAVQLAGRYPADAARVLEELPGDAVTAFLAAADEAVAAEVLGRMTSVGAAHYLEGLDVERAAALLRHRAPTRAGALLRAVDTPGRRDAILAALPGDVAEPLRRLLSFPAATVGAGMRPDVATVPDDATVGAALRQLRSHHQGAVPYVYVVTRDGRLAGATTFTGLLTVDPEVRIAEIARPVEGRLRATARLADVAAHPSWLRHPVLPVVDNEGVLIGVLEYRVVLRNQLGETADAGVDPVGNALGELYQIGLTGILRAAAGLHEPGGGGDAGAQRDTAGTPR